jgi:hypothetical protein
MGVNLWLWGGVAACLFWSVGVYNRITRLRARSRDSFTTVARCMHRFKKLLLEHIDIAKIQNAPDAIFQLWQQLQVFDQLIEEAQNCPWDKHLLSTLSQVWAEVAAAWGVLRSAPADLAGSALPENLMGDWDENSRNLQHEIVGFNRVLFDYNEAIAQFPATVISSFLGFKPAGQITIFHEV